MQRKYTAHRAAGILAATVLLAAPAPALARFDLNPETSSDVPASATTPSAYAPVATQMVAPTAGETGFDWGDAAIGAAGGVGLSVLLGGGLGVAQRRRRQASPWPDRTPTAGRTGVPHA